MPPVRPRSLNCTQCGSPISVRNGFKAKTAACPACGALLDLASKDYAVLGQVAVDRYPPSGHLCVGMRGRVEDCDIEVVGRLRFKGSSYDEEDGEEVWYWDEWLVLNEKGAYHWIAHDEGKYTLYTPFIPETPPPKSALNSRRFDVDDVSYRVKERDSARIILIQGEMTWRARIGDAVNYVDASGENVSLSIEWTEDEIEFYRCTPLHPKEIFTRFALTEHLRVLEEKNADQVRRARFTKQWLTALVILFVGALLTVCGGMMLDLASNHTVASGTVSKVVVQANQNPNVIDGGSANNSAEGSKTAAKGTIHAAPASEPQRSLYGQPNALRQPLRWAVDLDANQDGYVLKADVLMVSPVDQMYFVLISPKGTPHEMLSFQVFEPGWGTAEDSIRFSVPTSGTWTLQVGATTGGSPRITAPGGYRVVPPPQSDSSIKWTIRDQNVNAVWPCLGSFALLLLFAAYGLFGLIFSVVRMSSAPKYSVLLRTLSVEHHQRIKYGEVES